MSTQQENAAISMNPHQLMGAVSAEAHQPVGTQVPEAMPRRLAHPDPADAAPLAPAPQPSPVPTPLPVTVGPRAPSRSSETRSRCTSGSAAANPCRSTGVVNRMLQLSAGRGDPAIHRTFIRNRFAFREVVASPTPLGDMLSGRMNMANAGYTGDGKTKDAAMVKVADESSAGLCAVQDRSSCCGTLQLPEFQVVDRARLARRGSLYDDDILAAEVAELGRAFSKGV